MKVENNLNLFSEEYNFIKKKAKEKWDNIAKPIDSLGALEDVVSKLSAIGGSVEPYDLSKRAVVVMCADHGVVAEGVTQTGSEVTRIVAENFAKDSSSVNHMSKVANADVFVVDIGMDTEEYDTKEVITHHVINRKVARGTKNLATFDAMTKEECTQAIQTGIDLVFELKEQGYKILATGEMGIGNTTPTAVLAAKLLNLSAEQVTGRGAGLDDAGLIKKQNVVSQALERVKDISVRDVNTEEVKAEAIELTEESEIVKILAKVGGFEIAGMVGMFLGGVLYQMPIIIDGAISAVAALVASKIDGRVPDYAIASHVSEEITGRLALDELGLEAIMHGHFCLGEGTGAVALLPLMDMGLAVYKNMGSFSDLNIEAYDRAGKPDANNMKNSKEE